MRASAKVRPVLENGLFLGYFPEAKFSAVEVPFHEGDWLVLYTDGIPEMRDASDEQFGQERLQLFVEESADIGAAGFTDRLLEHLGAWSGRASGQEPDDDVTLLAIHFVGRT